MKKRVRAERKVERQTESQRERERDSERESGRNSEGIQPLMQRPLSSAPGYLTASEDDVDVEQAFRRAFRFSPNRRVSSECSESASEARLIRRGGTPCPFCKFVQVGAYGFQQCQISLFITRKRTQTPFS